MRKLARASWSGPPAPKIDPASFEVMAAAGRIRPLNDEARRNVQEIVEQVWAENRAAKVAIDMAVVTEALRSLQQALERTNRALLKVTSLEEMSAILEEDCFGDFWPQVYAVRRKIDTALQSCEERGIDLKREDIPGLKYLVTKLAKVYLDAGGRSANAHYNKHKRCFGSPFTRFVHAVVLKLPEDMQVDQKTLGGRIAEMLEAKK